MKNYSKIRKRCFRMLAPILILGLLCPLTTWADVISDEAAPGAPCVSIGENEQINVRLYEAVEVKMPIKWVAIPFNKVEARSSITAVTPGGSNCLSESNSLPLNYLPQPQEIDLSELLEQVEADIAEKEQKIDEIESSAQAEIDEKLQEIEDLKAEAEANIAELEQEITQIYSDVKAKIIEIFENNNSETSGIGGVREGFLEIIHFLTVTQEKIRELLDMIAETRSELDGEVKEIEKEISAIRPNADKEVKIIEQEIVRLQKRAEALRTMISNGLVRPYPIRVYPIRRIIKLPPFNPGYVPTGMIGFTIAALRDKNLTQEGLITLLREKYPHLTEDEIIAFLHRLGILITPNAPASSVCWTEYPWRYYPWRFYPVPNAPTSSVVYPWRRIYPGGLGYTRAADGSGVIPSLGLGYVREGNGSAEDEM